MNCDILFKINWHTFLVLKFRITKYFEYKVFLTRVLIISNYSSWNLWRLSAEENNRMFHIHNKFCIVKCVYIWKSHHFCFYDGLTSHFSHFNLIAVIWTQILFCAFQHHSSIIFLFNDKERFKILHISIVILEKIVLYLLHFKDG